MYGTPSYIPVESKVSKYQMGAWFRGLALRYFLASTILVQVNVGINSGAVISFCVESQLAGEVRGVPVGTLPNFHDRCS
jgi:hypothetical protein